jgi:hypothetical protein
MSHSYGRGWSFDPISKPKTTKGAFKLSKRQRAAMKPSECVIYTDPEQILDVLTTPTATAFGVPAAHPDVPSVSAADMLNA